MTVYNMERYLRQSIDSVVAQTYSDWELIVVDDGSTDGSAGIVDAYAESDVRIRAVHKVNSGLSDSRNVALDMVTGEYVGFIDSDDWYDADFLEKMVGFIQRERLDIAVCGLYFDYKDRTRAWHGVDEPTVFNREDGLHEIIVDKRIKSYVWNKLFRREMIRERMPVAYVYEDYATVFKWFANAERVGVLNVPMYHYRQRSNSIIHERNLTHLYDFFVAERDRTRYVMEHEAAEKTVRWVRRRIVSTAIGMSKDIARYAGSVAEYMEFRNVIVDDTREFLPCRNLSLRKRYRLWLLLNHPRLFYVNMKISYMFKFPPKYELFS